MKRGLLITFFSLLLFISVFNIIKISKEYSNSENTYEQLNNNVVEIIIPNTTNKNDKLETTTEEYNTEISENESSESKISTESSLSTEEQLEQSTETINKNPSKQEEIQIKIDWSSLPNNVIGWIYIENTNINYPIVQSKDNDYYLNHLYNGKKNSSGAIFLDYKNDLFNDKNSIIYGHNMKNGTMFHELKKFIEKDFFNKNNKIYIITRENTYVYSVYSCYSIKYYGKDNFSSYEINPENYNEWLNSTKKYSKYTSDISIDENSKIITLSTCMGGDKELRCIVHAVLN